MTLDGVEGQKKAAGQQKKDAPPAAATVAPEKTSDASKVMAAFKFKPTTGTSTPASTSKESTVAPSTTTPQVNANSNKSEVRFTAWDWEVPFQVEILKTLYFYD